jgi:hypothetical protein
MTERSESVPGGSAGINRWTVSDTVIEVRRKSCLMLRNHSRSASMAYIPLPGHPGEINLILDVHT